MTIQIISDERLENNCRAFELATEKKTISIFLGGSFTTVCVKNASHAAYRGSGRVFHGDDTLSQALDSYKDGTVKSMIEAAMELV